MRRLTILAAVAAVAAATSGCRCGGLFRRHCCVSQECSVSCDDCGDEHEGYTEAFEPVWEESIPVPRGR